MVIRVWCFKHLYVFTCIAIHIFIKVCCPSNILFIQSKCFLLSFQWRSFHSFLTQPNIVKITKKYSIFQRLSTYFLHGFSVFCLECEYYRLNNHIKTLTIGKHLGYTIFYSCAAYLMVLAGYSGGGQIYLAQFAWHFLVDQAGERYLQKYAITAISRPAVTLHHHRCSLVILLEFIGLSVFVVETTAYSPSTVWAAHGVRNIFGTKLGHH